MDFWTGSLVCGGLSVVAVGGLLFGVRRWMHSVAEDIAEAAHGGAPFGPMRISLRPVAAPELGDAAALDRVCGELLELGFDDAGVFVIDALGGVHVRGFVHPERRLLAAAYDHPLGAVWCDLVACSEDGRVVTATSSEHDSALDRPSFKKVLRKPRRGPRALLAALEPALTFSPVLPSAFPSAFEQAYAAEMVWRAARGGPSRDEIRRVGAAEGLPPSDEDVERTFRAMRRAALAGLDEVLSEAAAALLRDGPYDPQEAVVVHDVWTLDELWAELGHWVDPDRRHRALQGSPRDVFARANDQAPDDRRFVRVGTLTEPVPADVYALAPDDDDEG
ncbi:MAG: hypothetical protein H6742_16890 [Alphaproteobacteria bacterium]|nr:hypothetical protein [Alphaproteobacteria bacterium]